MVAFNGVDGGVDFEGDEGGVTLEELPPVKCSN